MVSVAVLGSGGREHALGYNLALDSDVSDVFYLPGNAGTAREFKGQNVPIDGTQKNNFEAVWDFIQYTNVGLVVPGPEGPLHDGLVDYLHSKKYRRVFGPTQAATQLEADKFYSYEVMRVLGIPQADSVLCHSTEEALYALQHHRPDEKGIVIKARGLTGGKGVTVCDSRRQARKEIYEHASKYGPEVLIAQRLYGQEYSFLGLSDGHTFLPIQISFQDHKRLLDGDKGPNTGGMGAYGPAPIAPQQTLDEVTREVMTPVVRYMERCGTPLVGTVYGALIQTDEGFKVLEFNVRFGVPEAQPAMMLVRSLYEPISLALERKLDQAQLTYRQGSALCVVLASEGYPGNYDKDIPICGLEDVECMDSIKIFHAGTTLNEQGKVVTHGGRVLGVTAYSPRGLLSSHLNVYNTIPRIVQPTEEQAGRKVFHWRTDIGDKAFEVR